VTTLSRKRDGPLAANLWTTTPHIPTRTYRPPSADAVAAMPSSCESKPILLPCECSAESVTRTMGTAITGPARKLPRVTVENEPRNLAAIRRNL
jgi:hypothetical protein